MAILIVIGFQHDSLYFFYKSGHLTMIDPDGTNEKKVSEDRGKFHPGDACLSPDGKKLAVLIQEPFEGNPPPGGPQRKLYVREVDEKEPGEDLGVTCQLFAWSPDGKQIVTSDFVDGPPTQKIATTHYLIDVKTKEKKALKLPENPPPDSCLPPPPS